MEAIIQTEFSPSELKEHERLLFVGFSCTFVFQFRKTFIRKEMNYFLSCLIQ